MLGNGSPVDRLALEGVGVARFLRRDAHGHRRDQRELLAAGFLHETVIGQRPNKASWYAVTWQSLDRISGYDEGAAELFKRSAYKAPAIAALKPTRDQLYEKWRPAVPETVQ